MKKLFFDSDSDEDFEGFTQAGTDVEVVRSDGKDGDTVIENNVSNRYYHSWLNDFNKNSDHEEVPNGISERLLFCLFLHDKSFVHETNICANQVKEKERGRCYV